MAIKVIVFDFDGTLIASNQLKYDAYFQVFPGTPRCLQVIRSVLSEMVEESRYTIIEEILKRLGETADADRCRRCGELATLYNQIVEEGAKTCPEIKHAGAVLDLLKRRYTLYLSSTTPDPPLREIVTFRGWDGLFREIFGYPRQKSRTLVDIMRREKISPVEMAVVGDGESDRKSAATAGCFFVRITDDFNLENLAAVIAGF